MPTPTTQPTTRRRPRTALAVAALMTVTVGCRSADPPPVLEGRPTASDQISTTAPGASATTTPGRDPTAETPPEHGATTPTDASITANAASTTPTAPALRRSTTGAALDGRWSTDGARIVDGAGNVVLIRGVNWFGFETAVAMPHGLWSRNLEEMLDQIASLGFNAIRLPFSAAMLDDGVRPSSLDEHVNPHLAGLTSLELMDRVIDGAGARGLAVILDRHALAPDNRHWRWYDEEFPHERLIEDWQLLAERYADRPHVVGADLYNEPHGAACWGCGDPTLDWKLAATEAGNAIHEIQPEWLIFVEGVEQADGASCHDPGTTDCTWWGGNLAGAFDDPVVLEIADKVVYSPHEYATSVHHQPWFDDPSFPDNLPPIWERFWGGLARSDTAPIMVGEFGTTLTSELDRVWLITLLDYLDELGAGFTYWTFNPNSGDTGGILTDDWITVDTAKMSLLEPFLVGPFDLPTDETRTRSRAEHCRRSRTGPRPRAHRRPAGPGEPGCRRPRDRKSSGAVESWGASMAG